MLFFNIIRNGKIPNSNEHLHLNGKDNPLPNGFFLITASQQRNIRVFPIFIKLMRSLNDKSVNKLPSKRSSGIANIHFCIEFDIMAIEPYDSNLIKTIFFPKKSSWQRCLIHLFKRLLVALCLCQVICLCFDIIKYLKRSSTTENKGSFTTQPLNLALILLLLDFYCNLVCFHSS